MMLGKPRLVILLFMVLVSASGGSGEDNTCPDQVVQSSNTTIEGKVDEPAFLPLKVPPEEKEKPCPDSVLQCPNITIEGKVGETVILPCSTKNKTDISHEQVEWLFENLTTGEDIPIHSYVRGKDLKDLSIYFANRTYLLGNRSSGNCSLSLVVAKFDSGTYHCRVPDHVCCPVTVKVLPKEDTPRMQDDTDRQNKIIGGVVGGVLGVGALIIIITLAYCYHEQLKNCCSRRKPNSQPINLGPLDQPQDEENQPADPNQNEEQRPMLENDNQSAPADGNELTADGNELTADGNESTADGNELTADGNKLTADGNKLTADGNEPTADGNELTADGNKLTADGNESTADGNKLTADGNEPTADGNKLTADGNKLTADGNEPTADGNEPTADGN